MCFFLNFGWSAEIYNDSSITLNSILNLLDNLNDTIIAELSLDSLNSTPLPTENSISNTPNEEFNIKTNTEDSNRETKEKEVEVETKSTSCITNAEESNQESNLIVNEKISCDDIPTEKNTSDDPEVPFLADFSKFTEEELLHRFNRRVNTLGCRRHGSSKRGKPKKVRFWDEEYPSSRLYKSTEADNNRSLMRMKRIYYVPEECRKIFYIPDPIYFVREEVDHSCMEATNAFASMNLNDEMSDVVEENLHISDNDKADSTKECEGSNVDVNSNVDNNESKDTDLTKDKNNTESEKLQFSKLTRKTSKRKRSFRVNRCQFA